jgi:hypothetical protein
VEETINVCLEGVTGRAESAGGVNDVNGRCTECIGGLTGRGTLSSGGSSSRGSINVTVHGLVPVVAGTIGVPTPLVDIGKRSHPRSIS